MSVAEKIGPNLPYLRRFARALTGEQERGDAYVLALLEALVADPASFPEDRDPRVALYMCFLKIYNSICINNSPAFPASSIADRRLEVLTPRLRQAFLLASVEGFTTQQLSEILNCTRAEAVDLVQKAGEEIAQQVATRILIIEDEPLIAMDLEYLIEDLGHQLVAIARTHREAVEAVKKHKPGLVLADIQLADGSSGLDAVNDIIRTIDVPVIFITAFPERLLTGERPEPSFLITKPFETTTVRAIISQALFFEANASLPSAAVDPAKLVPAKPAPVRDA